MDPFPFEGYNVTGPDQFASVTATDQFNAPWYQQDYALDNNPLQQQSHAQLTDAPLNQVTLSYDHQQHQQHIPAAPPATWAVPQPVIHSGAPVWSPQDQSQLHLSPQALYSAQQSRQASIGSDVMSTGPGSLEHEQLVAAAAAAAEGHKFMQPPHSPFSPSQIRSPALPSRGDIAMSGSDNINAMQRPSLAAVSRHGDSNNSSRNMRLPSVDSVMDPLSMAQQQHHHHHQRPHVEPILRQQTSNSSTASTRNSGRSKSSFSSINTSASSVTTSMLPPPPSSSSSTNATLSQPSSPAITASSASATAAATTASSTAHHSAPGKRRRGRPRIVRSPADSTGSGVSSFSKSSGLGGSSNGHLSGSGSGHRGGGLLVMGGGSGGGGGGGSGSGGGTLGSGGSGGAGSGGGGGGGGGNGRQSKRQPHNMVERKYREGLNKEMERLRNTLPHLITSPGAGAGAAAAAAASSSSSNTTKAKLGRQQHAARGGSDDDDDSDDDINDDETPKTAGGGGGGGGGGASQQRPSKAVVLQSAVEEIEMLRRDKAKLQDELEKVERERNRWRREVETMRMKGGGPEGPGSSSSSLRR